MTLLALALVLASAIMHATWNLLAKRVEGGAAFIWLFDGVSIVLYTPPAIVVALRGSHATALGLVLVITSGLLHQAYFLLLTRGYRAGDLSLVYPLARGIGPLLATIAAILLLGERPGILALIGTLLVVLGAVSLTGDPRQLVERGTGPAVIYALLTGATIAVYTLVDKEGVSTAHVPPILYTWGLFIVTWLSLTPSSLGHRAEVAQLWRDHRLETVGIGVLSPLAYILVLTALAVSPVSYIAPTREIGILFGVLMGTHFLREGDMLRRVGAAAAMVAGVVLLALT